MQSIYFIACGVYNVLKCQYLSVMFLFLVTVLLEIVIFIREYDMYKGIVAFSFYHLFVLWMSSAKNW